MPSYLPIRGEYAPQQGRINIGPIVSDTRSPATLLNGASFQETDAALQALRGTLQAEFSRHGNQAILVSGSFPVPVYPDQDAQSASGLTSPRIDAVAVKRLAADANLLVAGVARYTNIGRGSLGAPGGQCFGVPFSTLRLHLLLFDSEGRLLLDSQDIDSEGYSSAVTLHSVEILAGGSQCRSVARDRYAIQSLLEGDARRLVAALQGENE